MDINRVRPTRAEISLDNLCQNFKEIRRKVGNKKILAAVKANAYGHGMIEVSKSLEESGVDYFGVAILEEGIALRKAGIKKPILIFGAGRPEEAPEILKYDLTQTLTTFDMAERLSKYALILKKNAVVHIKVDTGMGRLGFLPEDIPEFVEKVSRLPGLYIEGIYSHFPSTLNKQPEYTKRQLKTFLALLENLREKGYNFPIKHIANSMAIIEFTESYLDMVRAGFILYGLKKITELNFSPVLSLKTQISFIKELPAGSFVSYGLTYNTKNKNRIAVLPIGYGDGLPRALSNRGEVLIRGKRFPMVGAICMDMTMVNVGNEEIKEGEEVVIIGCQGEDEIKVKEIAEKLNTFENEIVTRISARVPRVYIKKNQIVNIENVI